MGAVTENFPAFLSIRNVVVRLCEHCEPIGGRCYECSAGAVSESTAVVSVIVKDVARGLMQCQNEFPNESCFPLKNMNKLVCKKKNSRSDCTFRQEFPRPNFLDLFAQIGTDWQN